VRGILSLYSMPSAFIRMIRGRASHSRPRPAYGRARSRRASQSAIVPSTSSRTSVLSSRA